MTLALFLPQLPFADRARLDSRLWASPAIRRDDSEVQITPLAQGLRGMREYRIAFAAHSRAAAFCPPILQNGTSPAYRQRKSTLGAKLAKFTG